MNTFLPLPDFAASAASLHWRHLGKQRIEVWQILSALADPSRGWARHTALYMWRGYESALAKFGLAVHDEWISRGYVDTTRARLAALAETLPDTGMPWWITDGTYREACRSHLIAKNPEYYGPLWPGTPSELLYLYPDALRPGVYVEPKNRSRRAVLALHGRVSR